MLKPKATRSAVRALESAAASRSLPLPRFGCRLRGVEYMPVM